MLLSLLLLQNHVHVKVGRQIETGTKNPTNHCRLRHTHTFTHTQKHSHSSSKSLTFLQFAHRNVCSASCAFLFNYQRGPDGRRTRLVTSDTPLAEGSPRLPGWVMFSVRGEAKASVGVIWGAKGGSGTSRFYYKVCCDKDARKHLGTCECRSSHVTLSCFSDIRARLLLPVPHADRVGDED